MANYRIRIEIDHNHVEDGCDGEPLPESPEVYAGNEYRKDGQLVPYEDYLRTFGDPNRYTGYIVTRETQCECCGLWKAQESISTSLYDEYVEPGTYAADAVPDSLKDVAAELAND